MSSSNCDMMVMIWTNSYFIFHTKVLPSQPRVSSPAYPESALGPPPRSGFPQHFPFWLRTVHHNISV